MDLLQPVIRPYAWGSRYAIAELQGRPAPAAGPEAELWMGAHPSAPSGLERDGRATTLDKVIAADPQAELGRQVAERFSGRLPFLLKVLAVDKALSIQVHPSRGQAEAGYREEDQRGVPLGDPARNYVDDWPKPELACALTRFEALVGFRDPADAAALLGELNVGRLAPIAAQLASGDDDAPAQALAGILRWARSDRQALIDDVAGALARLAAGGGPFAAAAAALTRVAEDHPSDIGLVAALLMRYQVLEPGEAMFMPAGGLHAYLRGTCVELLANSDNVLRAGLTGKHIDVPELLRLTDPAAVVPVIAARPLGGTGADNGKGGKGGVEVYAAPVPEFTLYRAELSGGEVPLPGAGPRLVLCITGTAVLRAPGEATVKAERGESVFVPASDGRVTVSGPAKIFVAAPGAQADAPDAP
jgi:mannose-6-phosphate isomerase